MEKKIENGVLTVFLNGRIDSTSAPAYEQEIIEIKNAEAHNALVVDAEKLEYISSAGLRVILRLRKEERDLKIINASTDVYDVFEMTGFTEMIPVEKAYRRISVEGCEVIGKGANGEVYRLDDETIIKVYLNPDSLPDIQRERELARKAFVAGIPTAIPYDVVKVGDGYGSVFELLNAQSFAKLIRDDTENLDKYVGLYVELMKKIHSTEMKKGEMPDQKAVTLSWVEFLKEHLPQEQYEKLKSLVNAIPESNMLMHGDYHIKNVMMQNGEVLLIDMDTLCLGNPVFELASVFLAYVGFSELKHEQVQQFMGIPFEVSSKVWRLTLEKYFGTQDEDVLRKYEDKAKVIGYMRLLRRTIRRMDNSPEENEKIIANCKSRLTELLARVDSLAY